jgi:hypothetical protein
VKPSGATIARAALLAGTVRERPVLTGAAQETSPVAAGRWFAWTQGTTTPPRSAASSASGSARTGRSDVYEVVP